MDIAKMNTNSLIKKNVHPITGWVTAPRRAHSVRQNKIYHLARKKKQQEDSDGSE